jgi:hypothetical protein
VAPGGQPLRAENTARVLYGELSDAFFRVGLAIFRAHREILVHARHNSLPLNFDRNHSLYGYNGNRQSRKISQQA